MINFDWDEKLIYIVMEYCSGGDLSHFITAKRTLSEYLARRFLQQIASALKYMRSKKVCHMDLKPHNILLESPNSVVLKLADFGFAHYLNQESQTTKHLIGSPLYMAPEIVVHRNYNEKADLWSVGVILYECLFGRAPFASRTLEEIRDKLYDSSPVLIPGGTSENCKHLLSRLLQRDPEKRISFEDFIKHPFVDLEHKPSESSVKKATDIVQSAIEFDSLGNYKEALKLYSSSLQYFVSAIHYEQDEEKKNCIRRKVNNYMKRAEELKKILYPNDVPSECPDSKILPTLFSSISENEVDLRRALNTLYSAQKLAANKEFESAYKAYEISIEKLIPLAKADDNVNRKKLLQKQLSISLDEAEKIKEYLQTNLKETKEDMKKEEECKSKLCIVM
ncbi:DgyrCDS5431 [Dimorphilus gyrociliatus]|uniref:Serine/threonine-protein kinase ULK3 n=1 Tax=Dimorphilus gyrociliatus TaxID=2664684 RepID=A0A7I8VKJ4_9ANNE|nr:DgyrCDS5431 [Dimorphilus gyrociliatus]